MLTSYYSKVSRLGTQYMQPISISRSQPRWLSSPYPEIRELAPGPWFRSVSTEEYIPRYVEQMGKLDLAAVVDKILRISDGKVPVLLCWEAPGFDMTKNFCHRRLAAHALEEYLSTVEELVAIPEGYIDSQGLTRLIPNWDSADDDDQFLPQQKPAPSQLEMPF